jgi:hypothetical protein
MFYRFHLNLYAHPAAHQAGPSVKLREIELQTLGTKVFEQFLEVSFEQAVEHLTKLPRLDAEPDGFFVITGDHEGRRWQVDGQLFDFNDRLHRVELHGECPAGTFDKLLTCFGWPVATLAFELVQEGVALDEAEFRRWAEWTC